jgi:hypothetical protein
VGSHMAETGLTPPALGVKSFLVTFFQKSNCFTFSFKKP